MSTPATETVEAELRRRFDAGDLDGVLGGAIAAYGDELYGFLVGLTHDDARADDVFGATCERMWKGLPAFRWESTLRVWAYVIARREFLRSTRETKKARAHVPISQVPSVQSALAQRRATTPLYRKTEVKDRFAKLREQLPPEDHMLLGLRLDRQMAWNDIARVMGSDEGASLATEAAALRKRFERLKTRLRELLHETTPR